MRLLLLAGLCLALSGCVTAEQINMMVASSTPPTSVEKKIIKEYVRNNFKDPYSIRDAEVSYFFVNSRGNRTGCINVNAKNGFGGYIGRRFTSFQINGGHVVYALENDLGCDMINNKGIRWIRFPALERL